MSSTPAIASPHSPSHYIEETSPFLKTYRRRQYSISAKAAKFLNDLTTEIEQGWTSHGQTKRLLGRIALREYIFGHLLYGKGILEGTDLVQQIVKIATQLPGYRQWCRHQHENFEKIRQQLQDDAGFASAMQQRTPSLLQQKLSQRHILDD